MLSQEPSEAQDQHGGEHPEAELRRDSRRPLGQGRRPIEASWVLPGPRLWTGCRWTLRAGEILHRRAFSLATQRSSEETVCGPSAAPTT